MRGLKLGLGIGAQRVGAGGGPANASNTTAPSISEIVAYPGGAYTITGGVWSSATSIATELQTSPNGVDTWTDYGAVDAVGTWANDVASLFVRVKEIAQPGDVEAYSVAYEIGPVFDQIVDFVGSVDYISHAVTAPFLGMSAGDGVDFWMMVQFYHVGTGDGFLVGLGDTSASNVNADIGMYNTRWRQGGSNAASIPVNPLPSTGSFIYTGRFRNVGATRKSQLWCNDVVGPEASQATAISLTPFTTLRIGAPAQATVASTDDADQPISWVAFGRGNPAAAHAAIYNNGKQLRADDYDWGTDPNGATLDGFILLSRESPGNTTFTVGNVVDSVGSYDSWSQTGTMEWANRLPGFIDPAGDPPATPVAFISPQFATTDDTDLTICINTKNIGSAINTTDFTVTTLTHSVAGNIAGTVSGDTFPNPGEGTITYTIFNVLTGTSASGTAEVIAPADMPANPQFWTRYNENALVAAIEEYPTYGAGTTYANIAALTAGISAMGAGTTLTIENLTEAGTLTLPERDYGGATIQARFLHGVAVDTVITKGVQNLTIRGFSALNGGFVGKVGGIGTVGTLTMDHCTGELIEYQASDLTAATGKNFTLTNWIGPDDGTASQITVKANRFTMKRCAHGAIPASADAEPLRVSNTNVLIMDRVWLGDQRGTNATGHYDLFQTYGSGASGVTKGIITQSFFSDRNLSGERVLNGALFLTGIVARGFRIKDVAVSVDASYGIQLGGTAGDVLQDCRIENTTANSPSRFGGVELYSSFADNNVRTSSGTMGASVETNTYSSTVMATQYPDYNTYVDSWRRYRTPVAPFATRGAYALIAELEAKRLTL